MCVFNIVKMDLYNMPTYSCARMHAWRCWIMKIKLSVNISRIRMPIVEHYFYELYKIVEKNI